MIVSLLKIFVIYLNLQFIASVFVKICSGKNIYFNRTTTYPKIAVLIPCCNENTLVVERSLKSCINITYNNYEIFLIENSSDSYCKKKNCQLGNDYDVNVISIRHLGSKAAALNQALKQINSEYIVIIDADQRVNNSILKTLMSSLTIYSSDVVCIQSPQSYEKQFSKSFWGSISSFKNDLFYDFICSWYKFVKISPCLGTNYLLSTSYIKSIGGFPDYSLTEDLALTVNIYLNKKRIVYVNEKLGFGLPPNTYEAYVRQQHRWAKGTAQVLRDQIFNLLKNPKLFYLIVSFYLYYLLGGILILIVLSHSDFHSAIHLYTAISSSFVIIMITLIYIRKYTMVELVVISVINAPIHFIGIIKGLFSKNRGSFLVSIC